MHAFDTGGAPGLPRLERTDVVVADCRCVRRKATRGTQGRAIERGLLALHVGIYVKFTQGGAELFA